MHRHHHNQQIDRNSLNLATKVLHSPILLRATQRPWSRVCHDTQAQKYTLHPHVYTPRALIDTA
jgi:hypothetical protein